jgi:hypothetical protein
LTVSPSSGPDRSTVVLRGFSDCAVIDGHLLFTTYDGRPDNVVVRGTSKTYDYEREKYPFLLRLKVPPAAAPGPAEVYAEPFCGPPEEYGRSPTVAFRVERGRLVVSLSRRRLEVGDRLRIRAAACDGARGPLTVRVQVGGQVRDLTAAVDASGSASASVSLSLAGAGRVSLPHADAQCPGSAAGAPVEFFVAGAAVAGSPSVSAAPSPSESGSSAVPPTLSTSSAPAATASPAAPPRAPSDRDSGGAWPLALVGLAAAAAIGAAVALRHRRG